MAPIFKGEGEVDSPSGRGAEIRVPTAGIWVGLGAGILVVVAGFVWTIL